MGQPTKTHLALMVSEMARESLVKILAGCIVLIEVYGILHGILRSMKLSKGVQRQLGLHLQNKAVTAPKVVLGNLVDEAYVTICRIAACCKGVQLVLEGVQPLNFRSEQRRESRRVAASQQDWGNSIGIPDCAVRELLRRLTASEALPGHIVVVPVSEADADICHRLYHGMADYAMIFSNDGDYSAQPKSVRERIIYNVSAATDVVTGSLLKDVPFRVWKGQSLETWPMSKTLALVTLLGNDFHCFQHREEEALITLVDGVWKSDRTDVANLLAISEGITTLGYTLMPTSNGFLAALCCTLFARVDIGGMSTTTYPPNVLSGDVRELQPPQILAQDHRCHTGDCLKDAAHFVRAGDISCAQLHSADSAPSADSDPSVTPCDANIPLAASTTVEDIVGAHNAVTSHSAMAWRCLLGESVHTLQEGDVIAIPASVTGVSKQALAKQLAQSAREHARQQGHLVSVRSSQVLNDGYPNEAHVRVVECTQRASGSYKASSTAAPAVQVKSPLEGLTPLSLKPLGIQQHIARLARGGQREATCLFGSCPASQVFMVANVVKGALEQLEGPVGVPTLEELMGSTPCIFDSQSVGGPLFSTIGMAIQKATMTPSGPMLRNCFDIHVDAMRAADVSTVEGLSMGSSLSWDDTGGCYTTADATTRDAVVLMRSVTKSIFVDVQSDSAAVKAIMDDFVSEAAVNAVLLGKSEAILVLFYRSKDDEINTHVVKRVVDLPLSHARESLQFTILARALVAQAPMEWLNPIVRRLRVPIPSHSVVNLKHAKTRLRPLNLAQCEPVAHLRIKVYDQVIVPVTVTYRYRVFDMAVTWPVGNPSVSSMRYEEVLQGPSLTGSATLSLSRRQRISCHQMLNHDGNKPTHDVLDWSAALSAFRAGPAAVRSVVEVVTARGEHSHGPTTTITAARPAEGRIDWERILIQMENGRSLPSLVLELEREGMEVTTQDLANLRRRARTEASVKWLETCTSAEAQLLQGGDSGGLLASLFTNPEKVVVVLLTEFDIQDSGERSRPVAAGNRIVLKLPGSLVKAWLPTGQDPSQYQLFYLQHSDVARLQTLSHGEEDRRWCVLDQLLRPVSSRPSSLRPWKIPVQGDGKRLLLSAILHSSTDMLRVFARSPHQLHLDGTESFNREGYTGILPTGRDALGHNINVGFGLMRSENRTDFEFIVCTAMPMLLGRSLDRVCVMVSDGNQVLCTVIDSAISRGLYGRNEAVRRRCYFHIVLQPYLNKVAPLCLGDSAQTCPLKRALAICSHTKQKAATPAEVNHGLQVMRSCLETAQERLSAASWGVVDTWYHGISTAREKVFPGMTPGILTRWVSASSPVESEHAQAKGRGNNCGLPGVNKKISTQSASSMEDMRQRARRIRQRKDIQTQLCKGLPGVPMNLSSGFVGLVGQHWLSVTAKLQFSIRRDAYLEFTCTPLKMVQPDELLPTFSEDARLRLSEDLVWVQCMSPRCGQDGLPCQHVVDFNCGQFGPEDVNTMYLTSVHGGLVDEQVHFSSRSTLRQRALVRVDLDQTYPLESQGSQAANSPLPAHSAFIAASGFATACATETTDSAAQASVDTEATVEYLQSMFWRVKNRATSNGVFLQEAVGAMERLCADIDKDELEEGLSASQGSTIVSRAVQSGGSQRRYLAPYEKRRAEKRNGRPRGGRASKRQERGTDGR